MQKLLLLLVCFVCFGGIVNAEVVSETVRVQTSAPSGACSEPAPLIKVTTGSGSGLYQCIGTTWTQLGTGAGQQCANYQINFNQSTLAGTSGTTASVNLFTLPAGTDVTSIQIKPLTAFVATGMTALSMSLGGNSNNTAYSMACQTGGTCDLTAAASGTNVLYDAGRYSANYSTAHSVYAYFTSTGANLNTLTAGQVNAQVCTATFQASTTVVP